MRKAYAITVIYMIVFFTACNDVTDHDDNDLGDSLTPVENVTPIEGGEGSTMTVNRGGAYFSIQFENILPNDVIDNGTREGWCIDWQKPIDSRGGVYDDIPLYSTENVRGWEKLNYLLNIKDDLNADGERFGYREIQLAIWSLRGYPEFNLHDLEVDELPERMVDGDSEPLFSYEKVDELLSIVDAGYEDFEYEAGTKFAVIGETPSDIQTVITVVEKK
jgi:hypothetical protein